MFISLSCFVAGLLSILWLPSLSWGMGYATLVSTLLFSKLRPYVVWYLVGLARLLFFLYFTNLTLPAEYDNKPLTVVGRVITEPKLLANGQSQPNLGFLQNCSFLFAIDEINDQALKSTLKVQLYWQTEILPSLKDQYQLTVKLKPPHGYHNLGSFDYEKYCFARRIVATGRVLQGEKIAAGKLNLRERLFQTFNQYLNGNRYKGVILAITLGINSEIPQEFWRTIHLSGIGYLIAISGLHINLVANWIKWIISYCWSRFPSWCNTFPASRVGESVGYLAAFFYSSLTGFAPPILRAFLMLGIKHLTQILGLSITNATTCILSMSLILFFNPLNSLQTSFWLSYGAIGILILFQELRTLPNTKMGKFSKQVQLSLAIVPLIGYFFIEWPLISLLSSLLSFPLWTWIIIPASLLSLLGMGTFWGEIALNFATLILHYNWLFLERCAKLPLAINVPINNLTLLLVSEIAIFLCCIPWWYLKCYGIILLLPWLLNAKLARHLSITLLDVGQGLAVVIQTPHHLLVYDTGPSMGNSDAGERIITPFLRRQRVKTIDALIVSHGDDDHIGGTQSLLKHFKVKKIYTSVPEQITTTTDLDLCRSGHNWSWDQTHFTFLNTNDPQVKGNNASCVLKVKTPKYSILLPGDLERSGGHKLIKQAVDLKCDILVAPHHGSKGAFSKLWVTRVKPSYVLFPVGYRNRFKFPHKEVVAGYLEMGAQLFQTNQTGAIKVTIKDKIRVKNYRQQHPHLWHHPPN